MGHFSYIGNALIGDNVFIGSDSMLVAGQW
jgi:bifunctional N-acetylglucosamine-1-phosphate-uridyltransferase/glucosamine-1-phosphate-acetyltransferase GlmU-like protein